LGELPSSLEEFFLQDFYAPIGLFDFVEGQLSRRGSTEHLVVLCTRRVVISSGPVHIATLGEPRQYAKVTYIVSPPLE
jgi:hypothetical protein